MQLFEHREAANARQALDLLAGDAGSARVIAGGTDLLPLMKEGLVAPGQLINIKPARELRYLRFDPDGTLRIGALATLADLERHPDIAARLPILVDAVRDAATPQLRAMATVGGNLLQRPRCWYFRGDFPCWLKGGAECFARDGENEYHAVFHTAPCVAVHPSDLAPALVALGAVVTLQGQAGARTLPVADFFAPPTDQRRAETLLQPGELITEVHVPPQPDHTGAVYLKMMERQAWAFALVSVAAALTLREGVVERARVVLGGVATVPWRSREAEQVLEGKPFTRELAAQAGAAVVASATPLSENGYKVPMARELVRRAVLQAAGQPI